jgi:hypothetical protein
MVDLGPGPEPGSRIVREVFFDALGEVVDDVAGAVSIEVEYVLADGTLARSYLTANGQSPGL